MSSRLLALGWPQPIRNFKTGEVFLLAPYTREHQRAEEDAAIARLCNEEAIYGLLFQKRLSGRPYGPEAAGGFRQWADQGWVSSQFFVFLLRGPGGEPVGTIDIKGCDLEGSEIGYWCSSQVPGLMTNTVGVLVELARAVGFRRLRAHTRFDNLRSQAVLVRNGFSELGEVFEDGERLKRFEKVLVS